MGMQRTIVFSKGQIAHSWLPKADHRHMGRWHILPLMSLQAHPLLIHVPGPTLSRIYLPHALIHVQSTIPTSHTS